MSVTEGLWAVVEIMGRRTRAGAISDATIGGGQMLRIEHPTAADETGAEPLTEFYTPQAIFAIRPCTRDEAEKVAAWAWPKRLPTQPALGPALDDLVEVDIYEDDSPEWEFD